MIGEGPCNGTSGLGWATSSTFFLFRLFFCGGSGFTFRTTAFQTLAFVFIVIGSPASMLPLAPSALRIFDIDSKKSLPSYRNDPLSTYLIRTLSILKQSQNKYEEPKSKQRSMLKRKNTILKSRRSRSAVV